MSKKLTRSVRRELREKGRLASAPKVKQAQRVAERQAEEEAASARVAEAREEVLHHEVATTPKARAKRRDLTVLVLLGLTAIAAIIFYLTQRAPSTPSTDDGQTKPRASAAPAPGEPPR